MALYASRRGFSVIFPHYFQLWGNSVRLKNRVALITGAGRGIGRDIALAYAREGAHVVINDVDPATAETTAKDAAALGSKSLPVVADVAKSADINRLVDTIMNERGRKAFWEAWFRRLDTEVSHPEFSYKMAYRRMLEVQARQLWRFVRGEATAYHGFTTR